MHRPTPHAFRIAFFMTVLLARMCSLEGAAVAWGGAGSTSSTADLLLNTNWQSQVQPQAGGNPAAFGAGGSSTPVLANNEVFSLDLLTFNPGAQTYILHVNGNLNFVGAPLSAPFMTGVQNLGAAQQIFKIYDGGEILFANSTNAAFGVASKVNSLTYDVGDTSSETFGVMSFENNATAGGANINIYEDSALNFNNNSTAKSAHIVLQADIATHNYPTLNFHGSADGGMAIIEATGSDINFSDLSSAGEATITLKGAELAPGIYVPGLLDFNEFSSAGNGMINVVDGSMVTFFDTTDAEEALIFLGSGASSTSPVGLLDFLDESQAGSSTIHAQGGYVVNGITYQSSVVFADYAGAAGSTINLGDSLTGMGAKLGFYNFAGADTATINAGQTSTVVFNYHASADEAVITLSDKAVLNFRGASTSDQVTIDLAGSNTVVNFAQTEADSFSGVLTGNGTFNKVGAGRLYFSGTGSGFSGTTNVNAGLFSLDSSLGGDMAVRDGGTLTGSGMLLGNLTLLSGGKVSPGLGTLTVNGDYVQEADSTYQVLVDIAGDPSLINVGGTATLNAGAGINITTLGTGSQLSPNQQVQVIVLQASGGVSGTFSVMTSSNPLIVGGVSYDKDGVYVVFANTLSKVAATPNHTEVSNQLQTIAQPTASQGIILNTIASLPAPQAQLALDQLSGGQYSHVIAAAELSNQQFLQRLYDPLRPLITADPCYADTCYDPCADKGWGIWMDGGFDSTDIKGRHKHEGLSARGFDFTVGAQAVLNRDWTVGTALSYEKNHFHYHLGGVGRNYGVLGALYALYRPADYYILSDLIAGYSRQKLARRIELGNSSCHVHGSPEIWQATYYVEGGKDFTCCCLLLQPFLGLEAGYFRRQRITEYNQCNSLLNLAIDEKACGLGYSRLGVHLTTQRYYGIVLAVDLAWRCRLTTLDNDLKARFQGFGSSFNVNGLDVRRNSIDGALNLSATLANGWDVFIEASGQWWQRASFGSLLGGLEIDW